MEKIKGFIDHIIYRSEESGYTVFELVCQDRDITCVGVFSTIDPGETVEVTGEFISHNIYGEQLKVDHYDPIMPDDPISIRRYLGSGAIRGIGDALAGKIVDYFGEDTMKILEQEPERLAEVKGISERKAREIAVQYHEKSDSRSAFMYLQQFGISNNMAVRIYEEYGSAIYGIMKENPYKLAEDIRGISFKTADDIATKAGIEVDSQYRIKSGILYVLMESTIEGHMYQPRHILLKNAAYLLELPVEGISVELDNLAMERKVMIKKEYPEQPDEDAQVYIYHYYYTELQCAAMIHDLNLKLSDRMLPSEEKQIERKIDSLEKTTGIHYDELQRKAVLAAATNGILILSGGPGTGKTTTINAMIEYFVGEGMDILLAAPTGRAAKRMTEATGYEAKTIHRLLELSGTPDDDRRRARFERNEENPLEADVIIVDEMSMVDIFLFQSLLKAITPGTRLIMVGDVDQLPSVGPGQVLADLINSGVIQVIMLERIFRQSTGSDIVSGAHAIKNGQMPRMDNKSKDFFFLPRNDVNVIYKHLVQLIMEKLPSYVNASSFDIQILTPMKKGPLGVYALNSILQDYINPASDSKKEVEFGQTKFREGDKVMQIKNDYQLEWEIVGKYNIAIDAGMGVFNGDMGRIVEINDYTKTVTVEYDDNKRVNYTNSQLEELELAYAVTIHKSQGSEYPAVLLPIISGPKQLLDRNLLYTAITRAKNCVTILGSEEVIRQMVGNGEVNKRFTGLKDRILEVCG